MRILYLQMFPLYGSGSGTYARELAMQVAKRHDVAIIAPETKLLPHIKIYPIKLSVKIAFTGHPDWPHCQLYTKVSGKDLSQNYLSYFHAIVQAIDDFKPDIIHVHHLMPLTWIARFVKIAYGVNYVVTAHGSEIPTLKKDKRYPYLTIESLRKAVRIVTNSFWTKEWMQEIVGNEFNNKIRVIPGGVNVSSFPQRVDTSGIDKKYDLKNKKLVLFTGKLTAYKGVKYLIQAAKQIDGIIGITGDGPEKKFLEKLARYLGAKNVRFFGLIAEKELIAMYYRADVSVVPSVWDEPLGLVVLEAMAARTPVVVTKRGGIPLMVKDGYNGFFIKSRNPKDIAEKVNKLLVSDSLREKMGERARQTVLERFTWEIIAKRYEKTYNEFKKPYK